jgi:hypothetical protein
MEMGFYQMSNSAETFGAVPYRMRKECSNIQVRPIQITAKAKKRACNKIRAETDLQRWLQSNFSFGTIFRVETVQFKN